MTRVAILRPEPGASATLSRALERGLDAFAMPLFEVAPIAWTPPDPAAFDGLLLTSANALRHGGGGLAALSELPVYCVGAATAEAARAAGLTVAKTGQDGVAELLDAIPGAKRLLHLCGVDRITAASAHDVVAVPVYEARPLDIAEPAQLAGCVALVHSPRAGRRLAELLPDRRSTISIATISSAAAAAAGAGWRHVRAATRPDDGSLLALAAELCESSAG